MELVVGSIMMVLIWLWMQISRLTERVELIDRKLVDANDLIRTLQPEALDPSPATAPVMRRSPVVRETSATPAARIPAPAPVAPAPIATPPTRPQPPAQAATAPEPSRLFSEPATPEAEITVPRESWEMTVGTSWFNKIGVLTFVIGVALLVGYTFTYIGPAGRIAVGYVLSGTLLGAGVWLERRDEFRNYAYGLIAGGWGGIYFTTFAMHDVPAAKIIDSDLAAVLLLSLVAVGMISHSLRYRSEVVTSLAFVIAYATLALSPLSGFALAASIPLAISVLVVSQWLGWPAVSTIGIVSTYGVFALRSEIFPGGTMDPSTPLPYAILAAYWLTFEAADLIGVRARRMTSGPMKPVQVSMLALNAAGFLGSVVVISPGTRPELRATLMFSAGAAYIASAVIRAWLIPDRRLPAEADRPFDLSHAATAMAVLLFAMGIGFRFDSTQQGLAWLLETQLLFVAALTLRDRWLRRIASVLAAQVTMHVGLVALTSRGSEAVLFGFGTHAAIGLMVAMIWYANREAIRHRREEPGWLEPAYPWAGTALVLIASWVSLSPAHFGLTGWILTILLLEAGLRRDRTYEVQAYVAGAIAAYVTFLAFLTPALVGDSLGPWGPAPSSLDDWTVLPTAIAVCVVAALRLHSPRGVPPTAARTLAAGIAVALAAVLTLIFEWRVLQADAVAPAWVVTGVVLLLTGVAFSAMALRWPGYAMLALGTFRAARPIFADADATGAAISWLLACCIAVYAMSLLARRFTRAATLGDSARESEDFAISALMISATALVAGAILWQAEASTLTLALALHGLILMAVGLGARERVLRVSGLALLLGCLLKVFLYDLRELDALPRIFSFVVLGLVLLAISWGYTRFREQIRKLL